MNALKPIAALIWLPAAVTVIVTFVLYFLIVRRRPPKDAGFPETRRKRK